jgi:hypothetical protein
MKFPWKCPKCGAPVHGHGKGGEDACQYKPQSASCQGLSCEGLLCECEYEGDMSDHGQTEDNVCENAHCYHCGWTGSMPQVMIGLAKREGALRKAVLPTGVLPAGAPRRGWQKKAWDAGWRPR